LEDVLSTADHHPESHAPDHRPDHRTEEAPEVFESRKADHIRLALDERTQTTGQSGLDRIHLTHEAFPEIDFEEVSLGLELWGKPTASPLFISSMTAGHAGSLDLNRVMARVAEKRGWPMGVGSQRRQLFDAKASREWQEIRKATPTVRLFGNIGLAQLIVTGVEAVRGLAESLEAEAMIVHTNPLQECLQPEGTPHFKGGLKSIEKLVRELGLPVIIKETGCGFSERTLQRLNGMGVAAVDVAGLGGTHWGRIEGGRSKPGQKLHEAALTFGDWGVSTVESLETALRLKPDYQVWASGGVRSGLDAAKLVAIGAQMVGVARPVIEAALKGEEALDQRLELFEYELKTALFCTGSKTVRELRERRQWEVARI
jgi:isopentenyl-diphosphate delta-isomerase